MVHRIFLLSPAYCGGDRAKLLLDSGGKSPLALRLRSREGGRGDLSRGGLLLRAARSGEELRYRPLEGATRRGPRPPRLPPLSRQG